MISACIGPPQHVLRMLWLVLWRLTEKRSGAGYRVRLQ
jgi:hypothetical protein